jgi:hypothetical protein
MLGLERNCLGKRTFPCCIQKRFTGNVLVVTAGRKKGALSCGMYVESTIGCRCCRLKGLYNITNNSRLTISRWESCKNNTKGDADEYLCHACYIPKEDWQNALPQGYEDVKSMRELRARKKKLDNSIHDSQDAKSSNSK